METPEETPQPRSSSPPRPIQRCGVLWSDQGASGPVRLPEDSQAFLDCFNTIYGSHGLRMTQSGELQQQDGSQAGGPSGA